MTTFPQKEGVEAPAPKTEAPIPEPTEKEEGDGILNAKWSNATFRLLELCEYVANFDTVMEAIFTPNGLEIEGIDPTHVARLQIHLDRKDFVQYNLNHPTPIPLPLNFEDFAKRIKRFTRQEDVISMKISKDSQLVQLECRQIHFGLKPVEKDLELAKTLHLEFNITAMTKLDALIEVLEFAHDHTDYIEVDAQANRITVQGTCNDGAPFHKTLKVKELRLEKPARNIYHIECLLDILKITKTKLLDRLMVFLEFSEAMPLRLTIRFAPNSYVQAYLAPRVEEEEKEGITEELKAETEVKGAENEGEESPKEPNREEVS